MHLVRFVGLISFLILISSCTTPRQATEPAAPDVMSVDEIERPIPYPVEIPDALPGSC